MGQTGSVASPTGQTNRVHTIIALQNLVLQYASPSATHHNAGSISQHETGHGERRGSAGSGVDRQDAMRIRLPLLSCFFPQRDQLLIWWIYQVLIHKHDIGNGFFKNDTKNNAHKNNNDDFLKINFTALPSISHEISPPFELDSTIDGTTNNRKISTNNTNMIKKSQELIHQNVKNFTTKIEILRKLISIYQNHQKNLTPDQQYSKMLEIFDHFNIEIPLHTPHPLCKPTSYVPFSDSTPNPLSPPSSPPNTNPHSPYNSSQTQRPLLELVNITFEPSTGGILEVLFKQHPTYSYLPILSSLISSRSTLDQLIYDNSNDHDINKINIFDIYRPNDVTVYDIYQNKDDLKIKNIKPTQTHSKDNQLNSSQTSQSIPLPSSHSTLSNTSQHSSQAHRVVQQYPHLISSPPISSHPNPQPDDKLVALFTPNPFITNLYVPVLMLISKIVPSLQNTFQRLQLSMSSPSPLNSNTNSTSGGDAQLNGSGIDKDGNGAKLVSSIDASQSITDPMQFYSIMYCCYSNLLACCVLLLTKSQHEQVNLLKRVENLAQKNVFKQFPYLWVFGKYYKSTNVSQLQTFKIELGGNLNDGGEIGGENEEKVENKNGVEKEEPKNNVFQNDQEKGVEKGRMDCLGSPNNLSIESLEDVPSLTGSVGTDDEKVGENKSEKKIQDKFFHEFEKNDFGQNLEQIEEEEEDEGICLQTQPLYLSPVSQIDVETPITAPSFINSLSGMDSYTTIDNKGLEQEQAPSGVKNDSKNDSQNDSQNAQKISFFSDSISNISKTPNKFNISLHDHNDEEKIESVENIQDEIVEIEKKPKDFANWVEQNQNGGKNIQNNLLNVYNLENPLNSLDKDAFIKEFVYYLEKYVYSQEFEMSKSETKHPKTLKKDEKDHTIYIYDPSCYSMISPSILYSFDNIMPFLTFNGNATNSDEKNKNVPENSKKNQIHDDEKYQEGPQDNVRLLGDHIWGNIIKGLSHIDDDVPTNAVVNDETEDDDDDKINKFLEFCEKDEKIRNQISLSHQQFPFKSVSLPILSKPHTISLRIISPVSFILIQHLLGQFFVQDLKNTKIGQHFAQNSPKIQKIEKKQLQNEKLPRTPPHSTQTTPNSSNHINLPTEPLTLNLNHNSCFYIDFCSGEQNENDEKNDEKNTKINVQNQILKFQEDYITRVLNCTLLFYSQLINSYITRYVEIVFQACVSGSGRYGGEDFTNYENNEKKNESDQSDENIPFLSQYYTFNPSRRLFSILNSGNSIANVISQIRKQKMGFQDENERKTNVGKNNEQNNKNNNTSIDESLPIQHQQVVLEVQSLLHLNNNNLHECFVKNENFDHNIEHFQNKLEKFEKILPQFLSLFEVQIQISFRFAFTKRLYGEYISIYKSNSKNGILYNTISIRGDNLTAIFNQQNYQNYLISKISKISKILETNDEKILIISNISKTLPNQLLCSPHHHITLTTGIMSSIINVQIVNVVVNAEEEENSISGPPLDLTKSTSPISTSPTTTVLSIPKPSPYALYLFDALRGGDGESVNKDVISIFPSALIQLSTLSKSIMYKNGLNGLHCE